MKKLNGISITSGIVIEELLLFKSGDVVVDDYKIPSNKIKNEQQKLHEKKDYVRNQLSDLSRGIENSVKSEAQDLLNGHLILLDDKTIEKDILETIEKEFYNIDYAIYTVYEKVIKKFQKLENEYFRQRVSDIIDIRNRLLKADRTYILNNINQILNKKGYVIVADFLLPTEIIHLNVKNIKAIVLQEGGKSGHMAIMARNMDIPLIIQVKNVCNNVKTGDKMIVDATSGVIYTRPDYKTLEKYIQKEIEYAEFKNHLIQNKTPLLSTPDNVPIRVAVNIEWINELEMANLSYIHEIGLFRTEYMFMEKGIDWDEDSQYKNYKKIVNIMGKKPVTFRTIDIGGDKMIPADKNFMRTQEENPFLGCRAIRYSLLNKKIFQRQLRAILKTSHYGYVRILLPMISGREELVKSLSEIEKAKKSLKKEKIPFDENIEIGIMVEVPSVVFVMDQIADLVDFFSIGTNDLIQYFIAIDRNNPSVSHLYEPLHPGVLRLLRKIIDTAREYGKNLSLCGEIGGYPLYIPLLIGMGIHRFSMGIGSTFHISQIIQKVSSSQCEALAEDIYRQKQPSKSYKILMNFMKTNFKDLIESGMIRLSK